MPLTRRAAAAASLAALAAPRPARAAWPDRPLRVVCPYAAGANSDVQARIVAASMSHTLGQPVVVENRAGGGGSLGADLVAKSRPDGTTLLVGSNGPLSINPVLQPRLTYAIADFAPVGLISRAPHTVAVRADAPYATLADLVAAARAAPGRITMGSSGIASAAHFSIEILMAAAGIRVTHVPYRASSLAATDLVAGSLDTAMIELTTILPTLRGGQTRALAIAAGHRAALAPDLPTTAEAGLPGLTGASWVGVFAPAGTPAEPMSRLANAFAAALADPEVRSRIADAGAEVSAEEEHRPDGLGRFVRAEAERVREVARAADIRLE